MNRKSRSSESVASEKGFPPILSDYERQVVIGACRFVDEIVPASPYTMSKEYIQMLIEKQGVEYFSHVLKIFLL